MKLTAEEVLLSFGEQEQRDPFFKIFDEREVVECAEKIKQHILTGNSAPSLPSELLPPLP